MTGTVELLCSPSGAAELALLKSELDGWCQSTGHEARLTRLADHKDSLAEYLADGAARTVVLQVTPDVVFELAGLELLAAPPDGLVAPSVRAAFGAAFEVDGRQWAAPKDYSLITIYRRTGPLGPNRSRPTFMNAVYERIAPFLYAHGGGTVLDGGGGNGRYAGNLAGVSRIKELLHDGALVFPQDSGYASTVAAARAGAARSALEGPWLRREVPGSWTTEPVRALTGADTTLALVGGWAVSRGSDSAGWDMVSWLTASATLDRICGDGGARSARRLGGSPAGYRLFRPTAGARRAIWAWQTLIERLPGDPPEVLASALSVSSTEELG